MTRIILVVLALVCGACAAEPERLSLHSFPRSTLIIESGGKQQRFEVWLADTAERRTQGLMYVKSLPRHKGMLFLFGSPQPIAMWMKNTFIPLDMLFIGADGRIMRIVENAKPHSLKTIASMGPAVAVLELAGGESARLGFTSGDQIKHEAFTPH